MEKIAKSDFYIVDAIKKRWSPRSFDSVKKIDDDKIKRIFEAARWAASAYNAQPWRFIIGFKDDATYNKILETLVDQNKVWAKYAPILITAIAKKTLDDNKTPNHTAVYDLGQAVSNMATQATAEKLYIHQMAGFSPDASVKLLEIPKDYTPITVIALGYRDSAFKLSNELRSLELKDRERNAIHDFVFVNKFGEKSDYFKKDNLHYMDW